MIAAMPEFWKLYYQAAQQKTDYRPTDPGVLREGSVDQKAKLISALDPPSNEFAQANGVAGIALYHAVIGSDGKVEEVVAGQPIGFGLDESAERTIQKAIFQPAEKDGKPVPVALDLVVSFRIYSKRTSQIAAADRNRNGQHRCSPADTPSRQMQPRRRAPGTRAVSRRFGPRKTLKPLCPHSSCWMICSSFALCLAHEMDAPLGFFNRPLKRIAVLTDNDQELLTQALKAAITSGANEIRARVINEVIQTGQQSFPIPQRTAILHPFGGTHLKNLAHRAMEPLFQNLPRELGRSFPLGIACAVSLVDHQDQVLNLFANRFHQRQFFAGNRWIGSNHNQCCIDMRNECLRRCRISGED